MKFGPKKQIEVLLAEVNAGEYENFKTYLSKQNTLILSFLNTDKGPKVDFFHLGCALKNTPITALRLTQSHFDATSVEQLGKGLKETAVTSLYLAKTTTSDEKILEQLAKSLQGTAVKTLSLGHCNVNDDGAKKICEALQGTSVRTLDLSCNHISDLGAKELSKALKDSAITTLILNQNAIGAVGSAAIIDCIPDTLLMKVVFGNLNRARDLHAIASNRIENKAIALTRENTSNQALALNQRKLIQTPYNAICLTHLPKNEQTKYTHLPSLGNNPSTEDMLKFAGGILLKLGTTLPEVQAKIISYLPLMNFESAQKLQKLAKHHHSEGLQIEEQAHKIKQLQ